jgi:general secretion pathway protein D
MVRPDRRLLAVVLLLGLGPGCASAYRQGKAEAEQGNWDAAVARFTKALQGDPGNIRTKIALENARVNASIFHYEQAKKHLAANDLDAAADSLDIAAKYDPGNRSAADDLLIVRDKIRKRDEERQHRAEYDAMKARAQAIRVPVAVLSPRSPVPVVIKYSEASLEKILESLGKLAGVNILFDEGYRDKKYTVNLSGVTFQEALDQITFVNRLFYKVLDQNTLIIVPESRQKRGAYDDLMLRTFYLQNAEVTDTLNLIKTIAKIQTAAGNPSLGSITVVGTLDQLAWAARIIESNDKARGEVMIEVQIINVNRTKLKQYGLKLSNYGAGIAFLPSGNPGESSGGLTNVRAHLLSSFNLADFVVSVPTSIFAKFVQNDSNSRILASPRLRAAEGKKATLKIGQEVPIPVTTFSTVNTGVSSFAPATSFQYRNVGVNLDITPKVSASGDITLEIVADFSLLGENRSVGNSGDLPTFFTRTVSGTLRLRDGETSLIGGLLQQNETDSFTGVLGLQSIPLLNKIFTDRSKNFEESEILISITPHIVRGPKLTEEDMIPLGVGTLEVPKVEGARPSLFGPEPPPAPSPKPAAPVSPKSTPGAKAAPPTTPGGSQATAPAAPAAQPVAPPESAAPASPPSVVPAAPEAPSEAAEPKAGAGGPAAAAAPVTLLFSPPEASLKVGEKGSLGLVVVGARDLVSVEVALTYDATLVEVADVGPGSLLTLDGQPVGAEKTLEAGRARVRFTRTIGATGSGAIVSVTLKGLRAGSGALGIESLALGRAGETERPALPPPGRVIVNP